MFISTVRVAVTALSATLFLAACADDNGGAIDPGVGSIDPSARPDLVAAVMGKVGFAGQDAIVVEDAELPAPSDDPAAPEVVLQATSVTAQSGTRISFPFDVDSDSPLTALFAKVVGSPDLFQLNLNSGTKAITSFSFGFDLPVTVGNGTFCIDLAAQSSSGLIGRSGTPVCINVQGQASGPEPTTEPTAVPTPEPTVVPTPEPTEVPTPEPTVVPTIVPTPEPTVEPTPEPTVIPTVEPTPEPTVEPTAAPTPVPTVAPTATPTPLPTMSPTPTAAPTAGTAAACFNEEFFVQGTRFVLTYKGDDSESSGQVDFTDDRTVGGIVNFNGRQARETSGTTVSTVSGAGQADGTSMSETSTYTIVNGSVPSTLSIGTETTSQGSAQGFTFTVQNETDVDPGILMRFDLNPGESFADSYTTTVNTTTSGFSTTTVVQTASTVTYVGRETVSVPAGTFDTCRFDEVSQVTVSGQTSSQSSTRHFAVSTGVLVRQDADGDVVELQEAMINGMPIR